MRSLLAMTEKYRWARAALLAAACTFYALLVLWQQPSGLVGDEWRYAWLAENLQRGYFSPPDFVFLWNGPGYPLLQACLASLGLGTLGIRLLNALMLSAALGVFYAIMRRVGSHRAAMLTTLAAFAYLPAAAYVPFAYTEVLCFLLFMLFTHRCQLQLVDSRARHVLIAGVVLALLILTKVGFWPLLLVGSIGSAAFWWRSRHGAFLRFGASFVVALACCVPYLVYTQHLTGRSWYWGSATGSVLYWMTHPYPEGRGDWLHQDEVHSVPFVRDQHWALMNELGKFEQKARPDPQDVHAIARYLSDISSPEASDAFMRVALENLRNHPEAYLRNWGYNTSRLLLDYPYTLQSFGGLRAGQAVCNVLLLAGVLWAAIRLRRAQLAQPPLALLLLLVLLSAIGFLSLVSAVARYLVPLAPLALTLGGFALMPVLERRPDPAASSDS